MKLACYIAKNGTFLDKLIAWWTRPNFFNIFKPGKYSHVEFLFSDGWCFSASPREKCCRWKKIEFKENHWDFIELKNINERNLSIRCEAEEWKKYDYWGIFFTFIIPFDYDNKNKWFCSELVAKIGYNFKHSNRYHPNKLIAKILNKQLKTINNNK